MNVELPFLGAAHRAVSDAVEELCQDLTDLLDRGVLNLLGVLHLILYDVEELDGGELHPVEDFVALVLELLRVVKLEILKGWAVTQPIHGAHRHPGAASHLGGPHAIGEEASEPMVLPSDVLNLGGGPPTSLLLEEAEILRRRGPHREVTPAVYRVSRF